MSETARDVWGIGASVKSFLWRGLAVGGLATIALPAAAMPRLIVGGDLMYRRAEKVEAGLSLTTGDAEVMGTHPPSVRIAAGIGGASIAAGVSSINLDRLLSCHARAEVLQTFESSDWPSGTWVGADLSIVVAIFKLDVGQFHGLGGVDSERTQFGAGLVLLF